MTDTEYLNTRRLLHSLPLAPAPRVDTAYWERAEAEDLESRAENFVRGTRQ
jgi:hypothetical protein